MRGVMRKKRVIQPGKCCHLVSRVAHRAYFLDDEEKSRFVDLLRRVEFFCCVRVLAYCCMSNHIHVFMYLEEERELSEDEILVRANALYRGARLEGALGEWKALKEVRGRRRSGRGRRRARPRDWRATVRCRQGAPWSWRRETARRRQGCWHSSRPGRRAGARSRRSWESRASHGFHART